MTDDLRDRIAAALSSCQGGTTWGAMADAVMAVVEPELGRAEADPPELTRAELQELADDLGHDLYRAQDRIAFVREMLEDQDGPVEPEWVRAWLDRPECPRVESEQEQIARLEAALSRVREYCELTADSCRVQAREVAQDVLELLDGEPQAEEASR